MNSEPEAGIYARESAYLDRHVQVGVAGGRVLLVEFPTSPEADADPDLPLLDRIEARLEGASADLSDVDVAMTMPTDRRRVLETVRDVPYGDQRSVSKLATVTPRVDDDEEGRQLVRTALAENPAPLVVPDHRVRDGPSAAPPAVERRLRTVEGL